MKVFIAGAKSIKKIDDIIEKKLVSISQKSYDVLIGDCHGVDKAVQNFFTTLNYSNVTIYASEGKARNNLGNWSIQNVPVQEGVTGFEYYRQKDIAMSKVADCGFMIWDGKSKGTLNNIIALTNQNKVVVIYLFDQKKLLTVKTYEELRVLISKCDPSTQTLFNKYASSKQSNNFQLSLFDDVSDVGGSSTN